MLFNGALLEEFRPSRGIRQGDPISPYLSLLAAESLSCVFKSQVHSSVLNGVKVATTAPSVNHIMFPDDSLMFFEASTRQALEVKSILTKYCNALGKQINMNKSSIFFSKGCPKVIKQEIKDEITVHKET
jgi:hypothetical protein